ncbi:MAG: HD domain-containing phosphohydrolase [Aeromonas sp.]
MDDEILIIDDENAASPSPKKQWKVLVIDDDVEVHRVTRMTLSQFEFDGKGLDLLSAYSAKEAKAMLAQHSDVALMLLDVVMESDHAGLDVVRYVREELGNSMVRIVLRTGQPGQAPEDDVVANFDINDYKDKTELTSQKLRTLLRASLRSYRDIRTLERNRRGLQKVIEASRGIFEKRALRQFIDGAREQLTALLNLEDSALYDIRQHAYAVQSEESLSPFSPTLVDTDVKHAPAIVQQAIALQSSVYGKQELVLFCKNSRYQLLFHIEGGQHLSEMDANLLSLFTENIVVALENIRLNEVIADNQREIIYRIGELVESRSKESGLHVKRVALYTELFCKLLGLGDERTELIKRASPLHDIGKVGIPDAILHKPGKLTAEEWTVMKTHARLGQDMLSGSQLQLFQTGALIAGNHHEKWDGSGYPNGLAGDAIPLEGRIVALADVFDALGSDRCYKQAWPLDKVLALIEEERGRHFDPTLVDLMLANLEQFLAIRDAYRDNYQGGH